MNPALKKEEPEKEPLSFIRGAQILVVEDSDINQQVAREVLEQADLVVTLADNGKLALQAVQASEFDAVLMDIQMPEMDGLEATRRIRALSEKRFKTLPVIAMTANDMAGDREKCLEAGMNDHISKPLDPKLLLESLAKWIGARKEPILPATLEIEVPTESLILPEDITGIDIVNGLRRVVGNRQLYCRLLQVYQRDNESFIAELRQALSAGDRDRAQHMVHALKGVSGNLGVNGVLERLKTLEAGLKNGEEDVAALIGPLEQELQSVLLALADRLPTGEGIPSTDATVAKQEVEDVVSLLSRLAELARLLENNDMLSERVFSAVESELQTVQPELSRILAERLDALDFIGAAEQLAMIVAMLEARNR